MASVLDSVKHYQHSIEKYANDEQKVLKCIDKLYNLDVTVQHLQETGVGRTVNALRKEPGSVGQAARALVSKWKSMVAAEESDQEEQKNETNNYNGHESGKYYENDSSESRSKYDKPEKSYKTPKTEEKPYKDTNGDYGSKRKYQSSEEEEPESKKSRHSSTKYNGYKTKTEVKVKQEPSESEIDSQEDSSQSDSESDSQSSEEERKPDKILKSIKTENQSIKQHSSSSSRDKHKQDSHSDTTKNNSEKHHRSHRDNSEGKRSSEKSSSKEKSHSAQSHRSSKESDKSNIKKEKEHRSHESEKKHRTESSSKHSDKHRSSQSSEKQKTSSTSCSSSSNVDKNKSSSTSEKQKNSDEKHRSSSNVDKHSSSSSSEKQKSSNSDKHKHHSEKHSSKSDKEKQKHPSEKEISSDRHKTRENSSSSSKKENNTNSSSSSSSSSKDKQTSSSKEKLKDKNNSSKKENSHKSDKSHTSSKDSKTNEDKRKSESSHHEKSSKKSKHKSSSSKSGSSHSKDEEPKKNDGENSDDGIDCGSGASFAEALGMMISPTKPKKKPAFIKDTSSPNINEDMSIATLLAPTTKLPPLPVLEISALPEISPNYRPRPPPKFLPHFTDEEAMNAGLSSKNQRTKVYSGNKVIGKIPTLYEMCVQILQEHIDSLEYTGGVPYDILKPVVDRATPQQLFVLEHYNPYLMEDTDHLWQKFCEKSFRNKKRQEMETWREMYMRCQEEQEIKLKSLTANIKIAQEAKKAPIKQTKMAYVDCVVKPPRNIAKKQAQHGTAFATTASPAARVASLAVAPNVLKGGRPTAVPTVSTSSFKPKKAPLMQKALQFLRRKR